MIKNVTKDEVIAAAKESTLAAVECSMRYHLFNANIRDIKDADLFHLSSVQLARRDQHRY
jgi:hypothetical protein